MKIKAIASLCKKSKQIVLHIDSESGCQWLGNAGGSYPLLGMPWLEEENVFTIFDIPEDKRDKYAVSVHKLTPVFKSARAGERPIEPCKISIIAHDCELLPLNTSKGIVFINAAYLRPVSDMELLEFFERITDDGGIRIAVKCGMFLVALIAPYDIIEQAFVDVLEELTAQCAVALANKRPRETEED